MSAFMVSDDTIKAIAMAASAYEIGPLHVLHRIDTAKARGFCRVLFEANAKGLQERYGDSYDMADCPEFSEIQVDAVGLIKLVECFKHQACEWSDFGSSEAMTICNAAFSKAFRQLPGYEVAPWGL